MRGLLSLEPDAETLARLVATQSRLVDALSRQGVHFPGRLGATLLAWPFASFDELDLAVEAIGTPTLLPLRLTPLHGRPNDDRPAELGLALSGVEALQASLAESLKAILDPDPPKPAFIRLARISPPSRKVGAALRGSGVLGSEVAGFVPAALAIWNQTPEGFGLYRTIPP